MSEISSPSWIARIHIATAALASYAGATNMKAKNVSLATARTRTTTTAATASTQNYTQLRSTTSEHTEKDVARTVAVR